MNIFQNGVPGPSILKSCKDPKPPVLKTPVQESTYIRDDRARINKPVAGLLFITFSAICGFLSWIIIEYMSDDDVAKGALLGATLGAGAGSFVGGLVFFSIPIFEKLGRDLYSQPATQPENPHIPITATLYQHGHL